MKPIILMRAAVFLTESCLWGRGFHFLAAGLAPLLPKMPPASFGPAKCSLPLGCSGVLAPLWDGECDGSLGKLEKLPSLSFELTERLKFAQFNMVIGGNWDSLLSALDGWCQTGSPVTFYLVQYISEFCLKSLDPCVMGFWVVSWEM